MSAYTSLLYPKNPLLLKYVKYFWTMIGDEPNGIPSMLPPITDFDIVFSFDAGFDWKIQHQHYALDRTFTCGARIHPVYISAKGIINYLSATFHPSKMYPFLSIPLSDLRGEPVEIDLLPCSFLYEATERIANVSDFEQKAEIVEQMLLKRLAQVKEVENPSLDYAVNLIQKSEGRMSVANICTKTGIGTRKLERHFSTWIGISPKQFIKVERFNHLFTQIASPEFNQDWFDLVFRYGYHDQSHLIHDFKSMMEQTPEEFLHNLQNNPGIFAT